MIHEVGDTVLLDGVPRIRRGFISAIKPEDLELIYVKKKKKTDVIFDVNIISITKVLLTEKYIKENVFYTYGH